MLLLVTLLTLAAPSDTPSVRGARLTITLAHGSPAERRTKDQLERLMAAHDLRPWQFTANVIIDHSAIPHSHPTLTLHTRHQRDDELLLSTFVHEQLHWYLAQHDSATSVAMQELRRRFPTVPVGYPQGSSDEEANYAHLIITWLEFQANQYLLGELRAQQVTAFWATDHYTSIYRAVLDRGAEIGAVVQASGLALDPRRVPPVP
jgi:hypothetical protein